jgi:uncharacterized membrane protein
MKSSTPIRDLTAAARAGLAGKWGKSIGVLAVYTLLMLGVSLVPKAGPLLQLIFSAPLMVGLAVYFLAVVRGGDCPFNLLFEGFSRFGASFCTYLLVILICLVWMIPFIALIAALMIFLKPAAAFPAQAFLALEAILILIMTLCMLILQMRYGLALYVVADDPSARAREAVRRSAELMKGNYWRLGLLWLRFIGWQLLGILTLGIGFIWLAPYFTAAITAFYDDLTANG